jgi:hypothetical protein
MAEFEDETVLDLRTFPYDGIASGVMEVTFGPASDKFALLLEVDPNDKQLMVTIGNSPATSEIPTKIPVILRELADEIEALAERPDFLEWIYGTALED